MQQLHSLSSGTPLLFDHQRSFTSLVLSLRLCNSPRSLFVSSFCRSPPVSGWNQKRNPLTFSLLLFTASFAGRSCLHTLLWYSCSHSNSTKNVCVWECVCVPVCLCGYWVSSLGLRGNQLGCLILSRCYQEGLLLYKEPMWANKIMGTVPYSQFPMSQLAFSFSLLNGYWQVKDPLRKSY